MQVGLGARLKARPSLVDLLVRASGASGGSGASGASSPPQFSAGTAPGSDRCELAPGSAILEQAASLPLPLSPDETPRLSPTPAPPSPSPTPSPSSTTAIPTIVIDAASAPASPKSPPAPAAIAASPAMAPVSPQALSPARASMAFLPPAAIARPDQTVLS